MHGILHFLYPINGKNSKQYIRYITLGYNLIKVLLHYLIKTITCIKATFISLKNGVLVFTSKQTKIFRTNIRSRESLSKSPCTNFHTLFYKEIIFLYCRYFFNTTVSVDGFAEPYNLSKSQIGSNFLYVWLNNFLILFQLSQTN